jgi:MFS family permease
MMSNYLGAGIGQFLLLAGDPAQFQLFILASMVYSFALVPILLTRASAPQPSSRQRMKFKALFAISPVGVLGTICAGMLNSSLNGMGAVFAKEIGLSIVEVTTFMAAAILGGMLLQFPIGHLSDKFDRRTVLILTSASAALAASGVIWATGQSVAILFFSATIYGAICYTIFPLSTSQVNDLAPPDKLVQVSAGLIIAYGIGASIGPTLAAQAMGAFGPKGLFYFLIWINVILVTVTTIRIIQRDRGAKEKAPFMPLGGHGVSSKQLYTVAISSDEGDKPN